MRSQMIFNFKIICLLVIMIAHTELPSQNIPSSARSRDAINRVLPSLNKELSVKNFNTGSPIFIRIFKESYELEIWLYDDGLYELFKYYKICTWGDQGLGPKTRQGDGKAPEGFYIVKARNLNPLSDYHLAFNLGYPNPYDQAHQRTGSALMVHGNCCSIGCYAMTDKYIEEIYTLADAAFRNGQDAFQVQIFPFRMTAANLEKHKASEWNDFWRNLKGGYDYFEKNKIPPKVSVKEMRYVFD